MKRRYQEKRIFRIHDIAIEIWEEHKNRMRMMGVYRPSAKVAIDYLLVTAAVSGVYKIKPLTPKNNLYLEMCEEEE